MNSIENISKVNDVIRIMGRMPKDVAGKDPEEEGVDYLDTYYNVQIGTQANLTEMLRKAGYKVTKGNSFTVVIIGDNVSEEIMNSIPVSCKKIDVYSLASWLADNQLASKEYPYATDESDGEIEQQKGKPNILAIMISVIVLICCIVFLPSLFLVAIIFVPGALKVFLRSLVK